MFRLATIRQIFSKQYSLKIIRKQFHDEFASKLPPSARKDLNNVAAPAAIASKYQVFKDEDATIILDIEEERQRLNEAAAVELDIDDKQPDLYEGLNLERGIHGVFDIEDLVQVLERESGEDIFVCSVPKRLKYVDYICVVSGKSLRHRQALANFVRKMFKLKRKTGDILPKIEGANSKDWIAIDLGNIALHIFSKNAREQYDLESLWGVGADFDLECNKPQDELLQLYEKHSLFLGDLVPNFDKKKDIKPST